MRDSTRRQFLRASGIVSIIGLAGCSQITGEEDIKDTDGDGVIDSEDYAPRDASVQRAEQVEEAGSSGTSTEEPTEQSTEQLKTWNDFEGYDAGATPVGWDGTGIDDFEIDATTTPPDSNKSARLAFGPYEVYHVLSDEGQVRSFSCWFKSESYSDQQFQISLRDQQNNRLRCAEISTGRRNESVINANKFTEDDERSGRTLLSSPTDGQWYQVECSNFSWAEATYDITLRTASETVASLSDVRFRDPEIEGVDSIWIINHMNITGSPGWIGEIRIEVA